MSEMDMLSNLPEDIKEKILAYLPMKEAGRSSILSSKWRYTWAAIPELDFKDHEILKRGEDCESLVEFVDTIFALHKGSIRKFSLSSCYACPEAFDRWTEKLSKIGIREVTLELETWHEYEFHSSLFSCDTLTNLNLCGCSIKIPDHFKGLKLLHGLTLEHLKISESDFERLISGCPLLKELTIVYVRGRIIKRQSASSRIKTERIALNINGRNLESLHIQEKYSDIHIHAPKLKSFKFKWAKYSTLQVCAPKLLSIKMLTLRAFRSLKDEENFARFLANVPDLQHLEIDGDFLEDLSYASWYKESLLTFNCLKKLRLSLWVGVKADQRVISLLQKAPHLESLKISCLVYGTIGSFQWEIEDIRESLFKQLQMVKIINDGPMDFILPLAKLILGSASQLLTLTMKQKQSYKKCDTRMSLEQLMQFPRVSSKAEIIVK